MNAINIIEEHVVKSNLCKCHDGMDIRGRCDYIYDKKAFLKCPARVDTAYFCLMNDWETYDKLQKQSKRSYCEDGEKEIIRMFCHHTLGLKSIHDKRKVVEMYYEEKRREQEEEKEECTDEETIYESQTY